MSAADPAGPPAANPAGPDPAAPAERLVRRPVFVLSAVRSGSTLLRAVLGSHSQLHAPHEQHLKDIEVRLTSSFAVQSVRKAGLDADEVRRLLWDRLLHRSLEAAGKPVFVGKTPTDVFIWRELHACWPEARFVFLLRHPASVADSWDRAQVHWSRDEAVADVLAYVTALDEARTTLPGRTVRYEELTARPEETVKGVCDFIGVGWEDGMLDYGRSHDADAFQAGLGDWSERIRSGRPQPPRPLPAPEDVPEPLRPISRRWGYL